jgi:lipopolysaccharide transport system permease protein
MIAQQVRRFGAIWKYRGFIRSSVVNDIKMRFSRSNIGGIWVILQPLAQSAIFALVLSVIMKARLPGIDDTHTYAAYLLSGMLCWTLFTESLNKGLGLFLENAGLIKKVNFPLLTLPIIGGFISLANNFFLLLATVAILALLGVFPTEKFLLVPVLLLLTLGLGLGVGVFLGILNVFIRDIGVIVPIILQFMFWFCPIVYSPESLPGGFRAVLAYNPVSWIVRAYQDVLVFDRWPAFETLLPALVVALISWVLVRFLIRRTYAQMVDIL